MKHILKDDMEMIIFISFVVIQNDISKANVPYFCICKVLTYPLPWISNIASILSVPKQRTSQCIVIFMYIHTVYDLLIS